MRFKASEKCFAYLGQRVVRIRRYYHNYRFRKMTDFCGVYNGFVEILRSHRATQEDGLHHTDRKDVWATHTWTPADTLRGPIKGNHWFDGRRDGTSSSRLRWLASHRVWDVLST
ncbi:hypothetical protein LAZ67_12001724, partial [Cordylochernes scorpioides]